MYKISIYLHIQIGIMDWRKPLQYIFKKKISWAIKMWEIKGQSKGEISIFKVKYLGRPQKSNIFTHKMLTLHRTSILMPYLKSSGNFLLENVWFGKDRVNILQVMSTYILIDAQFLDLGGVTQKGASSKHTAIIIVISALDDHDL